MAGELVHLHGRPFFVYVLVQYALFTYFLLLARVFNPAFNILGA